MGITSAKEVLLYCPVEMADVTTLRRQRDKYGGQITKLKTKLDEWVSKGGLGAVDLLSIKQAKARLLTIPIRC